MILHCIFLEGYEDILNNVGSDPPMGCKNDLETDGRILCCISETMNVLHLCVKF